MPGTHALLSPSAAHRWINCTAAPRLEEKIEDRGSEYAAEGTLAHAYCAKKLKTFLGQSTEGEDQEIAELNEKYHTGEMDEYTDTYATIVLEKFNAARVKTKDAQLLVEVRLDFSRYVPDAFGTADAVIIADGNIDVIDFKYGKGVKVSAFENPQMMIYGVGAFDAFNFEYDIKRVKMTIVQPRIDNLSTYELSAEDLNTWAENTLKPAAVEAYGKNGKQRPGVWCQFCKVKSSCRALAATCIGTAGRYQDPKLVTPEEMAAEILPKIATIKTWLSGIEEFTLSEALKGVEYPGYKIVAGRSIRKIVDPQAVMTALNANLFDAADYLKPSELRSIGDLEKLVGKKRFTEICGQWIDKPQGKPALVPDSDKRPAFNSAADDFKNVDV